MAKNPVEGQARAKLSPIKPLTVNQGSAFSLWREGYNLLLKGTPRTGKTFLAVYLALTEVERMRKQKVYVVRSAVPSRDLGFLPGSLAEKMLVYETPYIEIVAELYGTVTAYKNLKVNDSFEFLSTSYLRGTTLRDAVVILDEVQNMSFQEIHTVMTRLGKNTSVIVCGDVLQCDLERRDSGFNRALTAFEKMSSFAKVEFTPEDIVGSPVIKEWLTASGQI